MMPICTMGSSSETLTQITIVVVIDRMKIVKVELLTREGRSASVARFSGSLWIGESILNLAWIVRRTGKYVDENKIITAGN